MGGSTATARAGEVLGGARRLVVLTGAGVSTGSGIPDFRGPNGLWTKQPEAQRLADYDTYVSDPEVRRDAWRWRASTFDRRPTPNPAHDAIARLADAGRLHLLITQNVDGLHADAGVSKDRTVEIHGTAREVVCLDCGARTSMQDTLERVRDGEPDPSCEECGGMLKAATISFGQMLDETDVRRAAAAAEACDVFLAAGTSLAVYPVASLPGVAVRSGARLVIANGEATPFDDLADVVVPGDLTATLPAMVDVALGA